MLKITFTSSIVLFVIALLTSCFPEPDIPSKISNKKGDLTYKIDGEQFTLSSLFTIAILSEEEDFYTIDISGINALVPESMDVTLSISGRDLSVLNEGDVFDAEIENDETVFDNYALGIVRIYDFDKEIYDVGGSSNETGDVTVLITKIDQESRLISGTFSFTAKNADSETIFSVTDGVFTELEYVLP